MRFAMHAAVMTCFVFDNSISLFVTDAAVEDQNSNWMA